MRVAREAGSQLLGEFLEWLRGERGVSLVVTERLTRWDPCRARGCRDGVLDVALTEEVTSEVVRFTAMPGETCPSCEGSGRRLVDCGTHEVPLGMSTEELLAQFFGVDLEELERERRALLDEVRSRQNG